MWHRIKPASPVAHSASWSALRPVSYTPRSRDQGAAVSTVSIRIPWSRRESRRDGISNRSGKHPPAPPPRGPARPPAPARRGEPRLLLVAQVRHVREARVDGHRPERGDPVHEGPEEARGERARLRDRVHADRRPRDDPEDPFGSQYELLEVRPVRLAREGTEVERAVRRDEPHADDEVLDLPVSVREAAGRPGRDPPADRRELPRLRDVTEGEAMRVERLLEDGPANPRVDAREPRFAVRLPDLPP